MTPRHRRGSSIRIDLQTLKMHGHRLQWNNYPRHRLVPAWFVETVKPNEESWLTLAGHVDSLLIRSPRIHKICFHSLSRNLNLHCITNLLPPWHLNHFPIHHQARGLLLSNNKHTATHKRSKVANSRKCNNSREVFLCPTLNFKTNSDNTPIWPRHTLASEHRQIPSTSQIRLPNNASCKPTL